VKEKQLESEEARPVASGERAVKNGGDPVLMVETRKKLQACLNLVRRPVAQPPVEAS